MIDWLKSLDANLIAIVIFFLTVIFSIVSYFISLFFKRRKKLKSYYELIGKKSSRLKPTDILKERGKQKYGFNDYYYKREIDTKLSEAIISEKHTVVIGNPISGKTRSVFNILKNINKPVNVIAPRLIDITTEDFLIPKNIAFWRKKVLLLDDIDKYVQRTNFQYLLSEFLKNDILIIATCRTGQEFEKLCSILETQFSTIFQNILEIQPISDKEEIEVAQNSEIHISKNFDGNIGSIFLELDAMRERYRSLDEIQKGILRSFKKLYFAGVYTQREIFIKDHINKVCKSIEEIKLKEFEWKNNINFLESQKFVIQIDEHHLWAEEVYLQLIVEDKFSIIDNIKQLRIILEGEPETLRNLASIAYEIGKFIIEKKEYVTLSINIYEEMLKTYLPERSPVEFALTQNSLGVAFTALAQIDNKSDFCRKAITAFEEALKVYSPQRFPFDCAMTQNNLGIAYRILAEVEGQFEFCRKAIAVYEKILKTITLEKFPIYYSTIQNNLGSVYGYLSERDGKFESCRKAISAFEESLKVRVLKNFPLDYSTTQSNIGTAYSVLARITSKSEFCEKAIIAFEEALKVRTLESFPLAYASIQNNLGIAYSILAEINGKTEFSENAISAFRESLKVRTLRSFPLDYAKTQFNLGTAYRVLAEGINKTEFCSKAIRAYKEALLVYTFGKYPDLHKLISNKLKDVLTFCKQK